MTITRKLTNQLDRIRREEDALLVLIIKPEEGYVSADAKLSPKDAAEVLRAEIPYAQAYLTKLRGGR